MPTRLLVQAALAVLLCASLLGQRLAGAEKPNILIYIADDHGRDEYGFKGNPNVHTPHIDQFRQQGMLLSRMATPTAMCAPSRSALYTGLWPQRNGCFMNHGTTNKDVRSLPHYLKPLGYQVVLSGKTHVKPKSVYPFTYSKFKKSGDTKTLDYPRMKKVMHGQKPFCLVVASNEPHRPYGTPRLRPQDLKLPPYLPDTPLMRDVWRKYLGDCERSDQEFGKVLSLLEASGKQDNTVVIYTSDHGHVSFAKWSCYQRGLEVTTIISWPGSIQPASESHALISFIDVLPTLVEIAGGKQPEGIDGKSFTDVLKGRGSSHREALFGVHTNRGTLNENAFPIRSITTDRYAFIRNDNHQVTQTNIDNFDKHLKLREDSLLADWKRNADDPFIQSRIKAMTMRPAYELYDLHADPQQLVNLAGHEELHDIQNTLAARLDSWLDQLDDDPLTLERSVPAKTE